MMRRFTLFALIVLTLFSTAEGQNTRELFTLPGIYTIANTYNDHGLQFEGSYFYSGDVFHQDTIYHRIQKYSGQ